MMRAKNKFPFISICFALLLSITAFTGCGSNQDAAEKMIARYEKFSVFGPDGYASLMTSASDGLAEIYVEFPDGKKRFLPDLTGSDVGGVFRDLSVDNSAQEFGDGSSLFLFENGELIEVVISSELTTWKIAAKKEGPYMALPISKEDLVANFGEPSSWE